MSGNNQPRSFKFYRQNEEEVMRALGLKPTKNSGSGWIEKEDGQSEKLICQLKSTDAQSIKVHQKDIRILEKNARVAHKIPVFAIQFLNTGEVWIMAKPEDLKEVGRYLETGECDTSNYNLGIDLGEEEIVECKQDRKHVRSSEEARKQFYEEKEK